MPGGLTLLASADAAIPTPPTGKVTIYFSTDINQPAYKDDAGISHSLVGSIGPQGIVGFQGEEGEEADIPPAIVGPQGNPGPTGSQGPMGPTLIQEEETHEDVIPFGIPSKKEEFWDETIIKKADELVTNSSAYVEDAALVKVLEPSGIYLVEAVIIWSSDSTAADYKWEWRLGANVASADQWNGWWRNMSGPTNEGGSNSGANCFWGNLNIAAPTNVADKFSMEHRFVVILPATTTSDWQLHYRFAQVVATPAKSAITYAGSLFRIKKLN